MLYIVITPDTGIWPDEIETYVLLFEAGLDYLHIRKPQATKMEIEQLIERIPLEWRQRVILHDHIDLVAHYGLQGWHLNQRNAAYLSVNGRPHSASCHTLEELESRQKGEYNYCFLSPIFDSVSKKNYPAAFTPEMVRWAFGQGIINQKTIALGGVTLSNLRLCQDYGFGGIALLGYIWGNSPDHYTATERANRFIQLRNIENECYNS